MKPAARLFRAVRQGNLQQVNALLKKRISKDIVDRDGNGLLVVTARGRLVVHNEIIQLLIQEGLDVNRANKFGLTALFYANLATALLLLQNGADVNKTTRDGLTPLHVVADVETAMLFMNYGADIHARDRCGYLPIDRRRETITEAIQNMNALGPRKRCVPENASLQREEEEVDHGMSNKQPRLDDGVVVVDDETKVASEDEDSEPSDGEDDS